jgi:hypothetical protein
MLERVPTNILFTGQIETLKNQVIKHWGGPSGTNDL